MFIEAKYDGGGGDNWTTGAIIRAKLQSNDHHQQTNIQFFYRPDALPVTQPTVSKHWREIYVHLNRIQKYVQRYQTKAWYIWHVITKMQWKKNRVISVVSTAEIFKTIHSSLIEQIHVAVAQTPSSQHQHYCNSLQVTISHQHQQPTEWSSSSTNNKTCNAVMW